jgi:CO/xanthine dehydrogenase Mo-binding subunit
VRVLRLHAAVYAGRVVNPLTAALQNEGSMIMGLGSALFEELVYDAGQPLTTNLSDYLIPSFLDLPLELTHDLLERPGAEIHGVGETALPPVPAAIGNAVARALGVRLTELPLTPERVLRALRRREERGA